MNFTISGLARAAGVGVETIRFYQRRALMKVPARSGGALSGIRRYGEEDLRRLGFIRAAQAAGFTLAEIAELLALDASDDRVRVRALARQRIDALDIKIAELTSARSALSRLARECAASDRGPCPILNAFEPISCGGSA